MIKHIFSVYDNKSCAYATPFPSTNKNTALRDFANAVKDPSSQLHLNPSDFSLHQIGTFDDESALLVPTTPPLFMANASQFVEHLPEVIADDELK
ncbi:hypothetical protein HGB07_06935 [Candidatus Roizmanbacteria bacterium]|nr:hypothetical protein [Candidatus Roizmanbacteria bacterium]